MANRKLASIQRIIKLETHSNADTLEIASILGWKCIVKKGEFKESDLVCFFEIDSFLPIKPEFEFLRKNCYKKFETGEEGFRIKTIRLRGVVSQGLCLQYSTFWKELLHKEGDDVSEELGVVQYNPPIPANMKGLVKGNFPGFIPKSDETRIQLLQNVLTRHKGLQCSMTEKVDGTSSSFYFRDGEFGVCSRNMELLRSEGNVYWEIADKYKIEELLKLIGKDLMIQGEIYGFGIQDNPYNLKERRLAIFNIFDIKQYRYFTNYEVIDFCKTYNLESVPFLGEFMLIDNIDELVKLSIDKSKINPDVWREGIVARPNIETIDLEMAQGFSNGRLSFKIINPEYLISVER
jgi:RNA ligase (TIGR02306 family)